MKKIYHTKFLPIMCGMVVMLALMAGIASVPVAAASNGIYIATATPHYQHPDTGIIEDAGGDGSAVLGQSMTESATCRQALVEVDSSGNTYITVRLQLMDNIQNPRFQVDGSSVSASLMQEDYINNTADYRMKVNSENSVIRCNMYVIAMGRDVIFYITVSNLQSGSGDFITSITVEEPKQPAAEQTQKPTETQKTEEIRKPEETQKPTETQKVEGTQKPEEAGMPAEIQKTTETQSQEQPWTAAESQSMEQSVTENTTEQTQTSEAHVSDSTVSPDSETKDSLSTESDSVKKDANMAFGLQEFDKEGNQVKGSETKKMQKSTGSNAVIWWIISGVTAVVLAGGCIWYFCFFKKRNREV